MINSTDYVLFKDPFNFEEHVVMDPKTEFRGNWDGTCAAQSLRWLALQQNPSLETNKGGVLEESLIDSDTRMVSHHMDSLDNGSTIILAGKADKTVLVPNNTKSVQQLEGCFSGLSSYVVVRFIRTDWDCGHAIGLYYWYFGHAKLFDPNHGEYTIVKRKNVYKVLHSFIEAKYGSIGSLVFITHLFSYSNPAKAYKELGKF